MIRKSLVLSSLILAVAAAAPADAKTSIASAKKACIAAVKAEENVKSAKVSDNETRALAGTYVFTLRVKTKDGASAKATCTISDADGKVSAVEFVE
ncbi:MAG: hypothetical protein R3C52_09780 [Hyphomonadaceae bacterium]